MGGSKGGGSRGKKSGGGEAKESYLHKIETIANSKTDYSNRNYAAWQVIHSAPKEHQREILDTYTRLEKERSRNADQRNRETAKKIESQKNGISDVIGQIAGKYKR